MSRTLPLLSLAAALGAGTALAPARADVPRVAADIAPVHSLVARVMEGVGAPDLVIPAGASPHEHSLRPSEARALEDADLVFWIGADLTPWLEGATRTLAEGAEVTSLLEAEGITLLEFREDALFEAHSHEDGDHDHDEHAREASAEEDHDHDHGAEEAAAHDHDHDHGAEEASADDHEGHDHGAHDPHAWLSPDNAAVWLNVIAGKLSATDPDNAGAYFANAAAAREEMDALKDEIGAALDPVRGGNFIVFHDAYQYFEQAFDLPAAGAISLGDAVDPSPARIAAIQGRVTDEGIDCVLAEPQYNPALVRTVLDGTEAGTGVLDPLGSNLEPGADLYPQLLRNLADALAECL